MQKRLSTLRATAALRPAGYVEKVLSRASRVDEAGDWYEISEADWTALCAEYRPAPMRGVGDLVAKATSALGIKPCAGCGRRQATANKWLPFG